MIELKVEEYCHNCPEFEAKCNKDAFVFTDGRVHHCNTIIICEHAGRCAAIKKHLENSEPKEEPVTTGPIKSRATCSKCIFCIDNVCGVYISEGCEGCPNQTKHGICHCNMIELGKPCPYYKESGAD